MYWVYILYSKSKDSYYTGSSSDPVRRLSQHNEGWTQSTKSGIPWTMVYQRKFASKKEAIQEERRIKKKKSRKYIEFLLEVDSSVK